MTGPAQKIIDGYNAPGLAEAFERLQAEDALAPVSAWLPAAPARVLDVGAGSGRDAAWLAGLGHGVTAVEPADLLRQSGQRLHPGLAIVWIEDRLPVLSRVAGLYDLILANAVWHHLPLAQRAAALARFVAILADGGRIILSVRHGPTSQARPGYGANVGQTLNAARDVGLICLAHKTAESQQPRNVAAGVTWSWLVLAQGAE